MCFRCYFTYLFKMPKVTCSVFGCYSSVHQLNKWKNEFCSIHQCHQGRGQCTCPAPFQLYPFPTSSHQTDRGMWINNINWIESVTRIVKQIVGGEVVTVKHIKGHKWVPSSYDRVCSKHFIEGKPTKENPYPVLDM